MRTGNRFTMKQPNARPTSLTLQCALSCVVVLCALLAMASVVGAQVIEQILVKVNGEVFSKTDLENRQLLTLRQRGQPVDLKSATSDQQLRKLLDEITPQLMVDAI